MYLASADWMTRNLDRRVEVVFPIYDVAIFRELRTIIDLQLSDGVKARIIDEQQQNNYVGQPEGKGASQRRIYALLKAL